MCDQHVPCTCGLFGCICCGQKQQGEQVVIVAENGPLQAAPTAATAMSAPGAAGDAQPPGATYFKNGQWYDANDNPVHGAPPAEVSLDPVAEPPTAGVGSTKA